MGNRLDFALLYNVNAPTDMDTMQAWRQAELISEHSSLQIKSAVVDRFEGLVLLSGEPNEHGVAGYHFQTPLCGYEGAGTRTAAKILAHFGFGDEAEIFAMIRTGNHHEFTR